MDAVYLNPARLSAREQRCRLLTGIGTTNDPGDPPLAYVTIMK